MFYNEQIVLDLKITMKMVMFQFQGRVPFNSFKGFSNIILM